ncbi:Rz1-like o-spanin [Klebsiella phage vB_Kpn_ZCKp20p]
MSKTKRPSSKKRKAALMPRALMLPLLLLSLAGCSNSSPQSESSSSIIPALSPLAIQPPVPEFCSPNCSVNLSKEIDSWQNMLTQQEKRD